MTYRKQKSTRRSRRRAMPLKRGTRIQRSLLPKSRVMAMKYYTGQIGDTTTTSVHSWTLRANSVHDPQYEVGGGQPMGHDQISALYRRYRVVGVSVDVSCQVLTANAVSKFGVVPLSSYIIASPPDTIAGFCEKSGSVCTTVTTESPKRLRIHWKPWNIEGITKSQYMNDAIYASEIGGNPNASMGINFVEQNVDGSTSTGHHVEAVVTYYVLWDIPIQLGLS